MYSKIAELINQSQKIIVFTGAGISTNSGIPDFRREGGLYEIVGEKYKLPYPEAIFDVDYFRKNPGPFFDLSKNLLSERTLPTACHRFLADLEKRGKSIFVITQNIDHLHQKAGNTKVMECHGTYEHGHCIDCGNAFEMDDFRDKLIRGEAPYCSCGGYIKPDIVFFGEQLPTEFYELYKNPPQADLILILGTSLKVQPAAGLALMIAQKVPSILVNRDPTDCDDLMSIVLNEDLDVFAGEMSRFL